MVEVIWPKVANSDNHSWDMHVDLTKRIKNQSAPMFDPGLSALISDLDERVLLAETLVVAVGEFGRSPQRGPEHLGQRQQPRRPRPLALLLHRLPGGGGHQAGFVYGKSDKTASGPLENPVHPTELWPPSTTRSASIRPRSSTTTSTSPAKW